MLLKLSPCFLCKATSSARVPALVSLAVSALPCSAVSAAALGSVVARPDAARQCGAHIAEQARERGPVCRKADRQSALTRLGVAAVPVERVWTADVHLHANVLAAACPDNRVLERYPQPARPHRWRQLAKAQVESVEDMRLCAAACSTIGSSQRATAVSGGASGL